MNKNTPHIFKDMNGTPILAGRIVIEHKTVKRFERPGGRRVAVNGGGVESIVSDEGTYREEPAWIKRKIEWCGSCLVAERIEESDNFDYGTTATVDLNCVFDGNKYEVVQEDGPLVFEVGKFYCHPGGRQIAIVGEVETTKWGRVFVLEEADATGHGSSLMEIADAAKAEVNGWTEIGREEWMANFKESMCLHCEKCFVAGGKFVPLKEGHVHIECYSPYMEMRGTDNIVTKENLH